MKTMATLLFVFALAGCVSTFDRFESAKQTCYAQDKKLLYNNTTLEPLACLTQSEYMELTRKRTIDNREPAAAETMAAGMILQGFALRPIVPAPLPYNPPPLPAFVPSPLPRSLPPISCSTNYLGAFTQFDCY